jgi:hypothetical protein
MTAYIHVLEGPAAGRHYAIGREVSRLGNFPGSDFPLGDKDILVLQRRGESYFLFNRGLVPVMLGEKTLVRGESAAWSEGQTLVLSEGSVLILRIHSNAKATAHQENTIFMMASAHDNQDLLKVEDPSFFSKHKMLAVVLCCAATAMFLFLGMNKTTSRENQSGEVNAAGAILHEVMAETIDEQSDLAMIRENLQEAIVLKLRGQGEKAQSKFLQTRNLVSLLPPHSIAAPLRDKLLKFISEQIP